VRFLIAALGSRYSALLDNVIRDGLSTICVSFSYQFRNAFQYKTVMAKSKKNKSHQLSEVISQPRMDLAGTEEHSNPSRSQHIGADWQSLGELELLVDSDAAQKVHLWLTESLKPLELQEDFINKVLKSAQGAVARIIQVESVMKFEHIHISLLVPPAQTLTRQSWGFFRDEKLINSADGPVMPVQRITFYLYLEG
jgi:hypothetical protein